MWKGRLGVAAWEAVVVSLPTVFPNIPCWLANLALVSGALVLLLLGIYEVYCWRKRKMRTGEAPPDQISSELDQIRRDVGFLTEHLGSYAAFEPEEDQLRERYKRLENSDHTMWLDPQMKQHRRDFLNRCGILISDEKMFHEPKERQKTVAEMSGFAAQIEEGILNASGNKSKNRS